VVDADFGFVEDLATGIGRHASTSECFRQGTSGSKPVKRAPETAPGRGHLAGLLRPAGLDRVWVSCFAFGFA